MRIGRVLTSGILIFILGNFGISESSAHAELESSVPAANSTLQDLPRSISLTFGEELLVIGNEQVNTIALRDFYDEDVSLSAIEIVGDTISASVSASSPVIAGEYRIVYRVVSGDGHPIEGEVPFVYAPEEAAVIDETTDAPVAESSETSVDSQKSEGVNLGILPLLIAIIVIVSALVLIRKRK